MTRTNNKNNKNNKQDDVFRKMTAEKKLKLASELTMFCLKLNRLNENNRTRKITS